MAFRPRGEVGIGCEFDWYTPAAHMHGDDPMWILRIAVILWAGFAISALSIVIVPGLVSAFVGLFVMSAALLLSAREVYRSER